MGRSERKRTTRRKRTSSDPRRLALDVLHAVLAPDAHVFAQDLFEERFRQSSLKTHDRRLAADIAYGVIRRLATLDAVLAAYASHKPDELEPVVLQIMRLGLYQILFHERVPDYAAVDECVRLARAAGKARAAGFINAVLRAISRDVIFMDTPDPEKPRRSFALTPTRACVFGKAVLPSPAKHARYLAAELSYPHWLIVRRLACYGASRTRELCAIGNEPPHLFVRPNALRNPPEVLVERLGEEDVKAVLSPSGRTLRLPPHTQVGTLRCFREGLCQVQDDSSAAVAEFLRPKPGEHVLDLCAAPGGKTCHIAELMKNKGQIVAVDLSERRLQRVAENSQRLGHSIIATVAADGASFARQNRGRFDRVLVDVPCLNTGVLRRRVEARWRLSDAALATRVREQRRLLEAALHSLKPGGTLVYSTCSLEPEENGELVRAVLRPVSGFRLDAEVQIMPSRDGGDGISMARIFRASEETADRA